MFKKHCPVSYCMHLHLWCIQLFPINCDLDFERNRFFGFFSFSCFNRFLFQVLELTTTENINFLEEFRKSTSLIFQNIGNNKGKKKNQLKQHQQANKKATIKWRKIDITPPTTIFCNDKNNKLITNTKHGIAPLMHKILHVYSSHWKSSISWYLSQTNQKRYGTFNFLRNSWVLWVLNGNAIFFSIFLILIILAFKTAKFGIPLSFEKNIYVLKIRTTLFINNSFSMFVFIYLQTTPCGVETDKEKNNC